MAGSPASRRLLPALALAAGLAPLCAAAAEPPDRELLILLRALAYDKNIADDADGTLTFGVLYRGDIDTSEVAARRLATGLGGLADTTVAGLRLASVLVPWESTAALEGALEEGQVDVVFLTTDLRDQLADVVGVTRRLDLLTLTAEPDYVYDGASLCVSVDGDRTRLLVNLPSARAEGSRFGAQFLDLATVIR